MIPKASVSFKEKLNYLCLGGSLIILERPTLIYLRIGSILLFFGVVLLYHRLRYGPRTFRREDQVLLRQGLFFFGVAVLSLVISRNTNGYARIAHCLWHFFLHLSIIALCSLQKDFRFATDFKRYLLRFVSGDLQQLK